MAQAGEIEGLDCEASASLAAALIMNQRFAEMWSLQEAALDWSDPDGVHDMRVAARRARSALADFAPFLLQGNISKLQKNLRRIGRALGGVRDLDVAIAALDVLKDKAPGVHAEAIVRHRQRKEKSREAARQTLVATVGEAARDKSQKAFRQAWTKAIDEHDGKRKTANATLSNESFYEVGKTVIAKRLAAVERLSAALLRPQDVGPLHTLRIAAKRLRYAVELWAVCWDGDVLAGFAKNIAKLQAHLGELHDCDVWVEQLCAELGDEGHQYDREEKDAAVWLMTTYMKERVKHYNAALTLWHKWLADETIVRLRAALAQPL